MAQAVVVDDTRNVSRAYRRIDYTSNTPKALRPTHATHENIFITHDLLAMYRLLTVTLGGLLSFLFLGLIT